MGGGGAVLTEREVNQGTPGAAVKSYSAHNARPLLGDWPGVRNQIPGKLQL